MRARGSAISCQALAMLLLNPKLREPGGSQLRALLDQVLPNFEDTDDRKAHICPPELLEEGRSVAESFGAVTVEQPEVPAAEGGKGSSQPKKGGKGKRPKTVEGGDKVAEPEKPEEKKGKGGKRLLIQRSQGGKGGDEVADPEKPEEKKGKGGNRRKGDNTSKGKGGDEVADQKHPRKRQKWTGG